MRGRAQGVTWERTDGKEVHYKSIVDNDGRAIVLTASKERAMDKQRAIHQFGADPLMENCLGSMSAVVEAAD